MALVNVDSHDFLGLLSIIKNSLWLALTDQKLTPDTKKVIDQAAKINQKLINQIKQASHG